MDITSPKGKKTVKEEDFMLEKFESAWKCYTVHLRDSGSVADGFFVRKKDVKAMYESKCRQMTLDELEEYGSWMISLNKIMKCQQISKDLCIPFYGLLYLVKDNLIMYWKITDEQGNFLFEFETDIRNTQYCVNGGEKLDNVALLPIEYGKYLQKK